MHAALLLSSLVAFFATAVSSTALTYKLAANEKSCFFAHVNQKAAKVAFYFAVRLRPHRQCLANCNSPPIFAGPRRPKDVAQSIHELMGDGV